MSDTGIPAPPSLRPFGAGAGRGVTIPAGLAAVAGATVVGCVLRAAAATGDLGLDEAWSVRLVAQAHGFGDVFWGISHDNNHLLNSAWLYLVGQHRPVWLMRLPAIAFGTATVPAMARLGWRRGPAAGVVAALLAAVAMPLVDFGSEARGYAGLVLAAVLALDASELAVDAARAGEEAACRRAAWRLAAAVGFGALCHLTMAFAITVVGVTALTRLTASISPRPALAAFVRIVWPSVLLSLPALGFLLAGVLIRGRFTLGDAAPFSAEAFIRGFGGMMLLTAGLSDDAPGLIGIAGALALLAVAARRQLVARRSVVLGVAALVVLPGVIAAARLPNVGYCRYFWVCGLVLLVLMAEALGTLWCAGPDGRRRATAAVLAVTTGSLVLDGLAVRDGRGGFGEALAIMRAEGDPGYATDHPVMAEILLGGATHGEGAVPIAVPEASFCAAPPDWYLAVGTLDSRPDATATVGAGCRVTYGRRKAFAASPLSGTPSTLYRRT